MSRFALIACTLALVACGGPPRTLQMNYMKVDVSDSQVAEDKSEIRSMKGVHNIVLEHERNGTARIQVYVLDGKEAEVMPMVEELGYTRVR